MSDAGVTAEIDTGAGNASEPVARALAVRWLAEAVHRRGDLYPYRGSETLRLTTRAEEGIATQRRIQRDRR